MVIVKCNLQNTTLREFVFDFSKVTPISLNEPTVLFNGDILYESGQGLEKDEIENYEKQLSKKLTDFGIVNFSLIELSDNSQDLLLKVQIENDDKIDANSEKKFIVGNFEKKTRRTNSKFNKYNNHK